MMKFTGKSLRIAIVIVAMLSTSRAESDPMRDFVVSCSYGVLAGTLVGGATLAFSDKPGENLNRVARGASLGLYAGMLLGAYVVFGVPADDEDVAAQLRGVWNESPANSKIRALVREKKPQTFPSLQVYPLLGEHGLEGAAGQLQIVQF